jgi:sporulation integral membrane protein YlbJ
VKIKNILSFRNISIAVILAFTVLFIARADIFLDSVRAGIDLYVVTVLPSMFPFFFFSKLLTELDFPSDAAKYLSAPMKKIFRVPSCGGYILIMSMLCGYPVGAKLSSEFFEKGYLDEKQVKSVAFLASTSGPLFIVGTVGVAMFDNKNYGYILLLCHYLGTMINGLIFRGKKTTNDLSVPRNVKTDGVLGTVMLNTFLSVGIVGGYIAIFNLFLDAFSFIGVIPFFASLLSRIGINTRISTGVISGLIEMTRGCLLLSVSGFPPRVVLPLCEFLITSGGLSVTFQSLSFLSKTKIPPLLYFLSKLSQGVICALLCFLASFLLV